MVKKIARSLLTGTVLNGASALAIKFAAAIAGFAMFALSSRYMEPASFGSLAIIFVMAAALIFRCRRLVGIDPSLGFALASTRIAQLKAERP